jgi:hypothetical protein
MAGRRTFDMDDEALIPLRAGESVARQLAELEMN